MRTSHTSFQRRALTGVSTLTLMIFGIGLSTVALNPAAASASPTHGYTCSGGDPNNPTPIPPGSYTSLTVTGVCFVAGAAQVNGGLTVGPNAVLMATDSPGCAQIAHLDVSGGIRVQSNGILFLGDSNNRPNVGTGCPTSNDVVNGGIVGLGANSVVIHGTRINGGFFLNGGGGGTATTSSSATTFLSGAWTPGSRPSAMLRTAKSTAERPLSASTPAGWASSPTRSTGV